MLSSFCLLAKRSTCMAAPPLPKNLAPLRFSGALFIDRVEKSCAFAYRVTSAFPFHAFTLFKGEGGPLAVDEGCPNLAISTPPKSRIISPHQALRASFPLRGKPCIEPCSSLLLRSIQDPSTDARDDKESIIFQRSFGARGLKIGLPKSIEELFGKRSGRRNGQNGKRSAPSAMAPCLRRAYSG